MSEKLCLQWNDFQENVKSAFGNLREDNDFADVTLACEDGQQVEAHKVILAASSPFFQKLLGRNIKHPHPLICMRGMKSDDLLAIVDFLYRGEANVHQDNLDSFLAIADELQVKGLMGKIDERVEDFNFEATGKESKSSPQKKDPKQELKILDLGKNRTLAIPCRFSGDLDKLEEKVKSMMEKSQNKLDNNRGFAYLCKVCGKEGRDHQIKDHIEAKHLEGVVIPCNLCDKTLRTRHALRKHHTVKH